MNLLIGRSKGGRQGHAPRGPNSFNFMQFSGKKNGQIIASLELAPPPRENPGSAASIVQKYLSTEFKNASQQ